MKYILVLLFLFSLSSCSDDTYYYEEPDSIEKSRMIVYISGAIMIEGVYELEEGSLLIDLVNKDGGFSNNADIKKINLVSVLEPNMMIFIPYKENVSSNNLININTSSIEELEQLPNIGKVTANNIINYRIINGPFLSIEDLKKVERITDKIFNEIKDKITVG